MSTPPVTPIGHAQPLPVDPDKTLVHQAGWERLIDFRNEKEEKKRFDPVHLIPRFKPDKPSDHLSFVRTQLQLPTFRHFDRV
jgi:hypothetical protein